MQLHNVKSSTKRKNHKRVGRVGKRGTYSGKGNKGQKSRAGASWRPDFRGGNPPVWKLFSKQRGATSKVEIKHRTFSVKHGRPSIVKLSQLNNKFKEGDIVDKKTIIKAGLVKKNKAGIKILSDGELTKKLNFAGILMSNSVKSKILNSGSTVK